MVPCEVYALTVEPNTQTILMKVDHKISAAYHHQSVGTIERNHQEFNKYLRQYLNNNLQFWDEYLDFFTFCYNIDKHGSNNYKYSPFELV